MSSISGVSTAATMNTHKTSTAHSKANRKDPLDSLVSAGTITKDQQSTIKKAFSANVQSNSPTKSNPLDSLVTAGTITQDQATSVDTALKAAHPNGAPSSSAPSSSDTTSKGFSVSA